MSAVIENDYSDIESEVNDNWETCVIDPDYEICDQFPHTIRRKGSEKIIAQTLNKSDGYLVCTLNRKIYKHHRLVALQFIPNDQPEVKTMIDHINRDRTDNHISNLRWVNASENSRNKSSNLGVSYTYVDDIADDCIEIQTYGNRTLEGYYYDENLDQFYVKDELDRYRILHVIHTKSGSVYIKMRDVNDNRFNFYVNKFKALYNID
jgi:hypothetical protein